MEIFVARSRTPILTFAVSDFGNWTAHNHDSIYATSQKARGYKNNFYTALYDLAMLGFTSHSKVPLRLAAMLGFAMSLLSLKLVAFGYFIYKLLFCWAKTSRSAWLP